MEKLECIVIAPGPSFYEFLKSPVQSGVILVGCSRVTQHINNLDYYVYTDTTHIGSLPNDHYHPGCEIWACPRLWEPRFRKFDDTIPTGGNSGGMAISLACLKFNKIGLVGFDGHTLPHEYEINMNREILNFWQSKGKWLYSLMENSIFNNRLLKC